MRVEDIKPNNFKNMDFAQDIKKIDRKDQSFTGIVKQLERDKIIERIKALIEDIDRLGNSLGQKMDILTLKDYKRSIKELLSYTIYSSHEYFSDSLFGRRGRHKSYGIVKKIDEKMDLLTQEIIKKEKDNIRILSYIGEIKGLILDLFL